LYWILQVKVGSNVDPDGIPHGTEPWQGSGAIFQFRLSPPPSFFNLATNNIFGLPGA